MQRRVPLLELGLAEPERACWGRARRAGQQRPVLRRPQRLPAVGARDVHQRAPRRSPRFPRGCSGVTTIRLSLELYIYKYKIYLYACDRCIYDAW